MPDLKTLVFVVVTAFSTFFFMETRHAPAAIEHDIEQVALRLDQKILSDQLAGVQARIWALEDRYRGGRAMPQAVLEEYRALSALKEQLKEKLK